MISFFFFFFHLFSLLILRFCRPGRSFASKQCLHHLVWPHPLPHCHNAPPLCDCHITTPSLSPQHVTLLWPHHHHDMQPCCHITMCSLVSLVSTLMQPLMPCLQPTTQVPPNTNTPTCCASTNTPPQPHEVPPALTPQCPTTVPHAIHLLCHIVSPKMPPLTCPQVPPYPKQPPCVTPASSPQGPCLGYNKGEGDRGVTPGRMR